MASSSLSFSPNEPRPYEVFLNFRGEYVRNNFVGHLLSALHGRGIRTYFDETNLQMGQTIGPELMKAIKESSIAIVVLSTNYATSTWCLNELVKIMQCNGKSEIDVFPIFYDVPPSDVRKQQNSFFEAFSNHEVNFKDDGEKVKTWREALTAVGNLKGDHIRGKDEASCIKKIIDKILRQLPVKASEFRKSCVGIESRISEIKKLVYSKLNKVIFIGLWGMGGIGKTTTTRALFEDCKHKFEGSCFLQNVKENKHRLHKLQECLLSDVLKTNFEGIHDVIEGSSQIHERLQFKKVLLIIDDVDNIEQLKALANQCNWFGQGSRVIITTRDKHIIDDVHIKPYKVQTLPESKALHLLCLHAFKNDHPPKEFEEVSYQMLRYVGGLPLALRVLGDHLYRRKKYVWKRTLNRLKDVLEDEIISKLQITFDGLNVLQQNIFLDISCLFRGESKHFVEERLESLGLHPEEGIDVLVQKSLINISSTYIEMHDLLQEMGWYIVRQRSNWNVRKYSRLWLKEDIKYVLSDITVFAKAERMCIPYDDDIKFKLGWEGAFRNMNKLSFLEIIGDFFAGNYDISVSHSMGQLNNKLRWFSWRDYPGKYLPKSFQPVNLVHLHMIYSHIKETPNFLHMKNLEVLDLNHSERLVHVHPSIGDHIKIKIINLSYCKKIKQFPKINQMKSLEFLNLSYSGLQCFPEIHGNLDSLRGLELEGTSINGLPTSIVGNATGLQSLWLPCHRTYEELKSYIDECYWRHTTEFIFPEEEFDTSSNEESTNDEEECERPYEEEFTSLEVIGGSFPGLVYLTIYGSGIVRTMDFSLLPYLEHLCLYDSKNLVEVHASLGVHKKIKVISLSSCQKLKEFPRIGDMTCLEELDLSGTSLQCFPEITGNMNCLEKLDLDGTEITTLPWPNLKS